MLHGDSARGQCTEIVHLSHESPGCSTRSGHEIGPQFSFREEHGGFSSQEQEKSLSKENHADSAKNITLDDERLKRTIASKQQHLRRKTKSKNK